MWLEIGLTTGGVAAFFLAIMNCDIDYTAENRCLDWVECNCCCYDQTVPKDDDNSSKSSASDGRTLSNLASNVDDESHKEEHVNVDKNSDVPDAIVCEDNIQTTTTMFSLSSQAIVEPVQNDHQFNRTHDPESPADEQLSSAKSTASSKFSRTHKRDPDEEDSAVQSVKSRALSLFSKVGRQKSEKDDSSVQSIRSKASTKSTRQDQQEKASTEGGYVDHQKHFEEQNDTVSSNSSKINPQPISQAASMESSSVASSKISSSANNSTFDMESNVSFDKSTIERIKKLIYDTKNDGKMVPSSQKTDDSSVSKSSSQSMAKESVSGPCIVDKVWIASNEEDDNQKLHSPTWGTSASSKLTFPPTYKGPRHRRPSLNTSAADDDSVKASQEDDISTDSSLVRPPLSLKTAGASNE